jgi:hypothetical protein
MLGERHRANLRAVTCCDGGGEHDFGSIEFKGERIFLTIDSRDAACKRGSEDPVRKVRVLTITLGSEY